MDTKSLNCRKLQLHNPKITPYGHWIQIAILGSLEIFALRYGNTSEVVTFILHMCDYVEYKLTGRNIGQLLSTKLIDVDRLSTVTA